MKDKLNQSTLDFIADLQQHNERDWFNQNKGRYEAAKQDFEELLTNLIEDASRFEPALKGQQAKETMFRIFLHSGFIMKRGKLMIPGLF